MLPIALGPIIARVGIMTSTAKSISNPSNILLEIPFIWLSTKLCPIKVKPSSKNSIGTPIATPFAVPIPPAIKRALLRTKGTIDLLSCLLPIAAEYL